MGLASKAIYLANRNPTLSRAAFRERWLRHPRIMSVLGDARIDAAIVSGRYCLATDRSGVLPHATDEHDGVALLSLASPASIPSFDATLTQNDIAYADELRTFARPVEQALLYTASELLQGGDETEVVVLQLGRRQAAVTPEEHLRAADEAQAGDVGERAARLGVRRWVRNVRIAPAPRGMGYDVVSELWFDSIDAVADASVAVEELLMSASPLTEPRSSVLLVTEVIMCVGEQRP